jgi:hypothetical protein
MLVRMRSTAYNISDMIMIFEHQQTSAQYWVLTASALLEAYLTGAANTIATLLVGSRSSKACLRLMYSARGTPEVSSLECMR